MSWLSRSDLGRPLPQFGTGAIDSYPDRGLFFTRFDAWAPGASSRCFEQIRKSEADSRRGAIVLP